MQTATRLVAVPLLRLLGSHGAMRALAMPQQDTSGGLRWRAIAPCAWVGVGCLGACSMGSYVYGARARALSDITVLLVAIVLAQASRQ